SRMRWPRRWRDALRQPGRLRSPDLRAVLARPPGLLAARAGRAGRAGAAGAAREVPAGRAGAPAGSLRTGRGAPLLPPVADELRRGHALLSPRLVHDEVQPEDQRGHGAPGRLRPSAPAG